MMSPADGQRAAPVTSTVEVRNELAYDLLQDHFETILVLLDRPLPRAQVVAKIGVQRLERLIAHGLVHAEGEMLRAVGGVYHQLRQEGMMSFLTRYVLPGLTATLDADRSAPEDANLAAAANADAKAEAKAGASAAAAVGSTLANLYLTLGREAAAQLRQGRVQTLFEELSSISEQTATEPVERLTVLVIGTTRIARTPLAPDDEALHHLRETSLERASADRDLAVLSQLDFMADRGRSLSARAALAAFTASFAGERAPSPQHADYHLTVASYWHRALAGGCSRNINARQPC